MTHISKINSFQQLELILKLEPLNTMEMYLNYKFGIQQDKKDSEQLLHLITEALMEL